MSLIQFHINHTIFKIMKNLLFMLTILISMNVAATNFRSELNGNPEPENKLYVTDFEEEEYINDIPFDTRLIAYEVNQKRHQSEGKRKLPVFIGIQPGYTAEQFYEESEIDLNVFPLTIQFPVGKLVDLRLTTLANYHLGGEVTGFADVGLQAVAPIYFKKKEHSKDLPRGFYAGPMVGFSRNLMNDHYTTNLAAEAGYQFPTSKSFSISMGLQFGATYFDYDDQPNVWRNHFGFKVNIGFWANQGKNDTKLK